MRKKVWVNQGDIILIGLRDYQDDKGDVIHKYTPEEARELKKLGELPTDVKVIDTDQQTTEGDQMESVKIEFAEV
jgi:translation initiation factor 1A